MNENNENNENRNILSPEQVDLVRRYQEMCLSHPLTCADRDHDGDDVLVAEPSGLRCPTCGLLQTDVPAYAIDREYIERSEAILARMNGDITEDEMMDRLRATDSAPTLEPGEALSQDDLALMQGLADADAGNTLSADEVFNNVDKALEDAKKIV